jgi:hypothetical protein
MRGKNVDTLTYSGPASGSAGKAAKAAKRRRAGCVSGFCRKQIAAGLVAAGFNSCDEVSALASNS